MCGICGYVGGDVAPETLHLMVGSIAHRGPDGSGSWQSSGIALGHTRLAVIDLTSAASQPMITNDGRYALVFNGEIYNYRELRQELEQTGEHFRSTSDTEVLLLGYRRWGDSLLGRLRGMFAFAVWDQEMRRLFMARDRLGIKPLFFVPLGEALLFASEIKALLEHPAVPRELNPGALDTYLTLGYIPGPETIFRGIRALMPGCWLEWQHGTFRTCRYWFPDFTGAPLPEGEDDLTEELDQRLNDAVRAHLVADVPAGIFLSGGVDSSLVAAIAQRHSAQRIRTYTIGFAGGGDERHFARSVAAHIDADHQERLVGLDLADRLPRLVWHLEQPLFDNSVLPTFLVSQFAREGVKVVLSGDGGDEPFAGYDWTRYALRFPDVATGWTPSGWHWAYRSGVAGLCTRTLYDLVNGADWRYRRRTSVPRALSRWLYTQEFSTRLQGHAPYDIGQVLTGNSHRDSRDRFLRADLCVYLPEDVLFKVDRMSMAHSLEVRVPLLDHELLAWILRLPFSMRFRSGRGKYLLRKVAARYLPPIIPRPRKQGFTVPMGRWLRGPLGAVAAQIFSSRGFERRGIVRPQAALALLALHQSKRYDLAHRIWSLVILETWARIWLDGADANAPLAELC